MKKRGVLEHHLSDIFLNMKVICNKSKLLLNIINFVCVCVCLVFTLLYPTGPLGSLSGDPESFQNEESLHVGCNASVTDVPWLGLSPFSDPLL